MARPDREAIDTFISITGSPEAVAVQTLQEYDGDLNQAVNAYFGEGDRNIGQSEPIDDLMEIDDPPEVLNRRPPSLFPSALGLDPFSLLDPAFTSRLFDRSRLFDSTSDARHRAPIVSHPREVREIPIEVKDGNESSARSGHGPIIMDVTDTEQGHGPEIRGTVTHEDDDTEILSDIHSHNVDDQNYYNHPTPSAPVIDAAPYDGNDIEEDMLRAAIEASKKDAEFQMHQDLSNVGPRETEPIVADDDILRAVSLSLQTAEQERALRELGVMTGESCPSGYRSIDVDGLGNASDWNVRKEAENSSFSLDVVDELEEQPLVRHRSRRTVNPSVNPHQPSLQYEGSHSSSDADYAIADQPRANGNAFQSDVWGGISSEEHDEAVMLEAAMFGRIPEEGGYNLSHSQNRPWRTPPPPSPGLAAQRTIREQQDGEYFAALQADREKELKALEEERAAKEAAQAEERQKEEEAQRKIEDQLELERVLAAKDASLPVEPAADDDNVVNLVVRMPDGSRRGRRFLRSDKLQSLYDFIDVGRAVKPGTYRLVRPFPRKPFSDSEGSLTLNELGLTSRQEALYLEPI